MVRQMVHRKSCSSLGQRTSEPHAMHVPLTKSLLAAGLCPGMLGFLGFGMLASSSESALLP